jgi:multiple sugar transport system permease protein
MNAVSAKSSAAFKASGLVARRNLITGLLFISPAIIGFIAFVAFPLVASFYYSLTAYNLLQPPQFIGFENYQVLLSHDKIFWVSVKNTLYMVAFALPLALIVNLLLAFLLNMKLRGVSIYRTIFYLPSILPSVAIAVIWLYILNPQYGLINYVLSQLNLPQPGWLLDPKWAKPSLIIVSLWSGGSAILIYLAGLQDVPVELQEAAELDGANTLQRTQHVTIPMITPVIFFNLVMGMIGFFQYFTEAYVMTRGVSSNADAGGPAESTLFYSIYLFQNGFHYFKMGYASAQAWILFWIVVALTIIIFRWSSTWVYYRSKSG